MLHSMISELDGLSRLFTDDLSAGGERLTDCAERTLKAVRFRQGPATWPEQFSPLVLLYPLLQAEPWTPPSVAEHSEIALAHLYQLIAAIIEDRLLDQQIEASPEALAFAGFCARRSYELLSAGLGFRVRSEPSNLAALYYGAQLRTAQRHVGNRLLSPYQDGFLPSELDAAHRALSGFVALACLLQRLNQNERLGPVRLAFDKLVVALQWLDDADDYEEDMAFGRRNLLNECCHELSGHAGVDGAGAPMARMTAALRAIHLIEEAIRIQSELGAVALGQVLKTLKERAERTLDGLIENSAGSMAQAIAG